MPSLSKAKRGGSWGCELFLLLDLAGIDAGANAATDRGRTGEGVDAGSGADKLPQAGCGDSIATSGTADGAPPPTFLAVDDVRYGRETSMTLLPAMMADGVVFLDWLLFFLVFFLMVGV